MTYRTRSIRAICSAETNTYDLSDVAPDQAFHPDWHEFTDDAGRGAVLFASCGEDRQCALLEDDGKPKIRHDCPEHPVGDGSVLRDRCDVHSGIVRGLSEAGGYDLGRSGKRRLAGQNRRESSGGRLVRIQPTVAHEESKQGAVPAFYASLENRRVSKGTVSIPENTGDSVPLRAKERTSHPARLSAPFSLSHLIENHILP